MIDCRHKPAMIIIEGVDRTGKTTLQKVLDRETRYRNIITIRGPVGFLAYNELYRKGVPIEEYQEIESGIQKIPHLMVYLHANAEVLIDRFKQTGEPDLPESQSIADHLNEYARQFSLSPMNKMIFDTGVWTPQGMAEAIVRKLETLYPRS